MFHKLKSFVWGLLILTLLLFLPVSFGATATPVPLKIVDVIASADDGDLPINTIDNNPDTRWSAAGDNAWIRFDLGTRQTIGYLGISFYKGTERINKFEVEISDDASHWTQIFAGANSGKTDQLEAFSFKPVDARYLRIIGHGNNLNAWNSISEMRIYPPNPDGPILEKLEKPKPELPVAISYSKPGLINPDGSNHIIPNPNPVHGKTLNVVDYGANPLDNNQDDRPAIQKAIDAAGPGDEVYFPNGVYNLESKYDKDPASQLALKTGVNLRGASETGVIIVSNYTAAESKKWNSRALKVVGVHDILISDLTVSSNFSGKYSTDTVVNNPEAGGPLTGIYIEDLNNVPSYNITVERVTVEKYQRIGIRVSSSYDVAVRYCNFKNATDVGGGGAGYGVAFQGAGHDKNRIGFANDCRFNLAENCTFTGPYIRHGVLIQYYAHNNLVRNNTMQGTCLDSIDMHGEDEYFNEICNNKMQDILGGGGVGVGNTGATHDASGPFNYIHDNTMINCREGIQVYLGSPDTVIANNTITGSTVSGGKGIWIQNAPRTQIIGNKIIANKGPQFWGILLAHDKGTNGVGAGDPFQVQMIGNTITQNTNGVSIETGNNIVMKDNQITDNLTTNFSSTIKVSDQPLEWKFGVISSAPQTQPTVAPKPTPVPTQMVKPVPTVTPGGTKTTGILPSDDSYIEAGKKDQNFGSQSIIRVKANPDGSLIRIIYLKYKVENVKNITEAVFQFTGKVSDNNPDNARFEFEVYGLTNDNWDEKTITWANSTNHAQDTGAVTGIGENAFLLGTVTMTEKKTKQYSLDVTKFVKTQTDGWITLMIVDSKKQDGNVDIFAKDRSSEAEKPQLIIK